MKTSIYYNVTKYLQILGMLVDPGHVYKQKLFGKNFYFNNINTFGILEKNLKELGGIRKDLYKDSDCYIDVGAHIGNQSLIFRTINRESPCIAFEPTETAYKLLEKNTEGMANIHIFNIALGENESEKRIFFDEKHLDVASLNSKHYFLKNKSDIKEQTVKVKRLDDFDEYLKDYKKIYLKIDAESYEDAILAGASNTLPKVKYLDLEIAQSDNKLLSETLNKINKKYNILDVDFFKTADSAKPHAVNLLLELFD